MLLSIAFLILVGLIYGFFTSFRTTAAIPQLEYIFTHVLAILGFGLLLVYFKFAIQQTIVIGLLVCFVNLLMGPMLQQFWYNVFTFGFDSQYQQPNPHTDRGLPLNFDSASEHINNVTLGFSRISTFCSISLLVALTSVIGRIGILNTFITTVIFNIGFNLSYYLNFNIYYRSSPAGQLFIMDDLQGSRVFAFGAGFGLALVIFYNRFVKV